MTIDIDHLNYDELVALNRRIVERLKVLDQLKAHAVMMEFDIGEWVVFDDKAGRPITGIVTKYNRKTVNIVTEDGQQWRVAPQLLRRANSQPQDESIVESRARRKRRRKR